MSALTMGPQQKGAPLSLAVEVLRLMGAVSECEQLQAQDQAAKDRKEAQRRESLGQAKDARRHKLLAETLATLRSRGGLRTNELAAMLHHERSLMLRVLKTLEERGQVVQIGSVARPIWDAVS